MTEIDVYLKEVTASQRAELQKIRQIVRKIVPEVEEVISYGMPGFKYQGKYLCGFNAFKDHLSFFPTAAPIEALKSKLTDYKLSKGTIQFKVDKPLPEEVIKEIVLIRVASISKPDLPERTSRKRI